jgi:hypothetical protein
MKLMLYEPISTNVMLYLKINVCPMGNIEQSVELFPFVGSIHSKFEVKGMVDDVFVVLYSKSILKFLVSEILKFKLDE